MESLPIREVCLQSEPASALREIHFQLGDYLRGKFFQIIRLPPRSPSNNIYSDKMCKPSLNTILKFDLALTENRFLSPGLHDHGRAGKEKWV